MPSHSSYNAAERRRTLQSFIDTHELEVQTWTKSAGMSESVVRHFLAGRSASMSDKTYARLAAGASELLGREVVAAELRGDPGAPRWVPISSRVGAGEVVFPIEGDADLGRTPVPPGADADEAFQVDGDSMRPLYGPRDVIFPSRQHREPALLVGRIVVAQIKDGARLVKQLQRGSRRDRWNLVSINPAHPTLEDQRLEWVARIAAAIYAT
ncbi:MAG TPA: S24 family peptidase [Reyranella sp.]|nr:S24 family peptidase [Reyranella sp.]